MGPLWRRVRYVIAITKKRFLALNRAKRSAILDRTRSGRNKQRGDPISSDKRAIKQGEQKCLVLVRPPRLWLSYSLLAPHRLL
jgi:hypothetical protein